MLATLKVIREIYGDAEKYMLEKCGLSNEEIAKIKANMIVQEPADFQKVPQVL